MEYLNPNKLDEMSDEQLWLYQIEVQKMLGRYAAIDSEIEEAWNRKYPKE